MSRPPLLLVHGFLSTPTLLLPMRRRLAARGFDVHLTALDPLCVQSVSHLATQLDQSARRVLSTTGAPRLDVLGASQGGLVALYWLQELGGAALTRRFISVGSPFQGTWVAVAAMPALGICAPGLRDLVPGGPFARTIAQRPLPPGLQAHTFALQGDLVSPPARCRLPGVPYTDIALPNLGPAQHQLLVLSRRVTTALADALDSPAEPPCDA